jgi:S1-C subfamily serine protease
MWLTVRSGEKRGTTVHVENEPLLIGRDEDCDLVLPDSKVSRRHASVAVAEGETSLRDLGSRNGTFVNGRRVEAVRLVGHEQIQVGDTVLASSPDEPLGGSTLFGSATLGAFFHPESPSAVHRLLVERSLRRATLLAAAAIAAAAGLGLLVGASFLFSDGDGASAAVQKVVGEVAPSTVLIEARHREQRVESGSGWVLDAAKGLIVTNAHVVNGGTTFQVARSGEPARKAELVGVAPCEDLAVLRVTERSGLRSLPLGRQSTLELGETVVALGYPANASEQASLTSTSGVVSVVRSSYREPAVDVPRYPNVIQTDAAINPGNSGGPLVDLTGRLVGVNAAGRTVAPDRRIIQGQGYAIGVDRVKTIVDILRTGRSLGWSGLGFRYSRPGEAGRAGLGAGPAVPGTSAERAGLGRHEGALIVAVDGMPVDDTLASYCDAIDGLRSGDRATFSILEPGKAQPTAVSVRME